MIKNLVRLEHVVEGKVFHFVCDPDSPTSCIKEALFSFLKYIGNIEDQAKAQREQEESKVVEESPKEE